MPYDPANFVFLTAILTVIMSGEATVWKWDNPARCYKTINWSPVYVGVDHSKVSGNKSKWWDIFRKFNCCHRMLVSTRRWLVVTMNFRSGYGKNLEANRLPALSMNSFCGIVILLLRWDLTRNLHRNFQSATRSQIEEPYTIINKFVYADRYQVKIRKRTSIKQLGTPPDYQQTFTLLPASAEFNPIFLTGVTDAHNANYTWVREWNENHISLEIRDNK